MKRLIVAALEGSCTLIDNWIIKFLPERLQMHWYCQLAGLSARLDDKWKTGVWHEPSTEVSS